MKNVLVTGGTGNLGGHVIAYLNKKKYPITVLSTAKNNNSFPESIRIINGDLAGNTGLEAAVHETDIIVHCASDFRNFNAVDITGTTNLIQAAATASVKHFIYISIVGTDKSHFPYYQAKHTAEKIIMQHGIPYTILRSAQFHEFAASLLQTAFGNSNGHTVTLPSGLRFQTVSIGEVAEKLSDLCDALPAGLLPDFAGPEILTFEEMATTYVKLAGLNLTLKWENSDDDLFNVFRSGINLSPSNKSGKLTWKEFLEMKFRKHD